MQFIIGVASAVALSAVMAFANGQSIPDALLSGLADGIFWGGVFAFITAGVNAVKAGVRSVRNAKLAGSKKSSAQPCDTVNQCFKEGTLVETEEGLKPIDEIEVGDKVLAYDEQTGEQAYKSVVRLFRNTTKEWYHIHVNGEEIICTGGHPFYVIGKGFVPAKELKETDLLELADCTAVSIDKITIEKLRIPETTYNFEVADFHTYYVSKAEVLVHNDCKVDAVIQETLNGKGNITSSYKLTTDEALDVGQKFLGENYVEIGKSGSGVFKSGNRIFRIDSSSLAGLHNPYKSHFHLEILDEVLQQKQFNVN